LESNFLKIEFYKKLQVPVPPEPLDLRTGVTVDDIALIVLETPRDNNKDVPFTDPDLLFYLALDTPHPADTVKTPDPDMICTHHQFGTGKYLAVPRLGQPYPDNLLGSGPAVRLLVCQYIISLRTALVYAAR
jgi:hypothetical protein